MKIANDIYLTGKPEIDKYLVSNIGLLNPSPDNKGSYLYISWCQTLDQNLNKTEFQELLSEHYPEDFEETLQNYYLTDPDGPMSLEEAFKYAYHATFETIYDFVQVLVRNDTWCSDILSFVYDYRYLLRQDEIEQLIMAVAVTNDHKKYEEYIDFLKKTLLKD